MFYYKLNLLYENFIWAGSKAVKYKNFISPQWLKKYKIKKISFLEIRCSLFLKKKYSNLNYIKNGGWHFTCIRTPEDLKKNYLILLIIMNLKQSGLKINDLKNLLKKRELCMIIM